MGETPGERTCAQILLALEIGGLVSYDELRLVLLVHLDLTRHLEKALGNLLGALRENRAITAYYVAQASDTIDRAAYARGHPPAKWLGTKP